ncbi:MAG: hypothetical protein LQ350_006655 [Teloschistes chrysophthalmus]|nr:MAG: hypothetical protein LQ350_006655 [Niorma chrysophthalma]
MLSLSPFAALFLLPALISAKPLPGCSNQNIPCRCPRGNTFDNYTTSATIAANAHDVQGIAYDYYETDWFNLPISKTRGPDNKPGVSVRTLPVNGKDTTYDLVERLTAQTRQHDGSFYWKFEQVNVGIQVPPQQGGGSFNGYWPSFRATQHRGDDRFKTDVSWNVYYCVTGHPFDFARFHEGAVANISMILEKGGKLRGRSSVPVSVCERRRGRCVWFGGEVCVCLRGR